MTQRLALLGPRPAQSLHRALYEHWEMTEASGNRAGKKGRTLTDNGPVGSAAGLSNIGLAASFTGVTTEYLSGGDIAKFYSGDWTLNAWAKATTFAAARTVAGAWQQTGNKRQYLLDETVTPRARIRMTADGSTNTVDMSDSVHGALAVATWYMLTAMYDASSDYMLLVVNGQRRSVNIDKVIGGVMFTADADFRVGLQANASGPMLGLIGPVSIWQRKLTQRELLHLFNENRGRAYPWRG